MSDHDAAPDPMDEAYVRAEAMLSDDDARAARRARVLAAVAREPAASATLRRRPGWGRGGWLAVACVVALSLFVTAQIYQPSPFHPLAAPKAPVAPTPATTPASPVPVAHNPAARTPATRGIVGLPAPPAPPSSQASASGALAAAPRAEKSAAAASASEVSRDEIAPIAPPPPPPIVAPAPRAFPAAAVPAAPASVAAERPAPPRAADSVGTLSAGASDEAVEGQSRDAARRASTPTFAGPPAAEASGFRSSAGLRSDPAARLRAAAAAGRTAEVEALLGQGAPVDAPDAAGDTALMKSLQADRPAAAAALRRHGASLDHKNHAGKSARDIATAKGDPDLDQAIGLAR